MYTQLPDFQKFGKDALDNVTKVTAAVTKNSQAIATEYADFSKKSFEGAQAAMEKLFAVKSLDKAFEVQTEYAKSAYEGFVAHATKVGEMYQGLARDAVKPFEAAVASAKTAAK
ncbi:MAG: phasin family protein [Beijerinckiaceae bacterium]